MNCPETVHLPVNAQLFQFSGVLLKLESVWEIGGDKNIFALSGTVSKAAVTAFGSVCYRDANKVAFADSIGL